MYLAKICIRYLERIIWLMTDRLPLGSALFASIHSPYWLILPGSVGVNLIIFALSASASWQTSYTGSAMKRGSGDNGDLRYTADPSFAVLLCMAWPVNLALIERTK